MFPILSKLFGTTKSTPAAACPAAALQSNPQPETLEQHQVMSATIISGDLYAYGNNANNSATVDYQI